MYPRPRHQSMPNPTVPPRRRPDSRTIFQQNQTQFQESIACNHRGPNGVRYGGEVCEICFCRMADVPLGEIVPLNIPRSQTLPVPELSPHYGLHEPMVLENFLDSSNGTETLGSRIFTADPVDLLSARSDPRMLIRVPVTRPEVAGADTIARLNDDPVRLDDFAFGGGFDSVRSTGTRRMKFDPPVKPMSMKSMEKKGFRGFLERTFGRRRKE